jgi:hypothetical protein
MLPLYLRLFPVNSYRLPDFFNKSKALDVSGDFFLAKSLFNFTDYFKSLKFFCLEDLSFMGLALLFCLRVTEFFRKFLFLDKIFSLILLDDMIFELIYF